MALGGVTHTCEHLASMRTLVGVAAGCLGVPHRRILMRASGVTSYSQRWTQCGRECAQPDIR